MIDLWIKVQFFNVCYIVNIVNTYQTLMFRAEEPGTYMSKSEMIKRVSSVYIIYLRQRLVTSDYCHVGGSSRTLRIGPGGAPSTASWWPQSSLVFIFFWNHAKLLVFMWDHVSPNSRRVVLRSAGRVLSEAQNVKSSLNCSVCGLSQMAFTICGLPV